MESAEGVAPARLRALPSWLLNQSAIPANRLVTDRFAEVDARRYHYAVLAALAELGPHSQAALGRRCGIDRSDMVAAVNELAERGILRGYPPSPAQKPASRAAATAPRSPRQTSAENERRRTSEPKRPVRPRARRR